MTYQGSFTTQQDILVYQQPQPQQPSREQPWDPHPELNLLESPSMQTSIWEDEDGNYDGAADIRLTLFIASSSIIILSLITIIGVVSCFILCNNEPEFSEMVVAAANLVTKHGVEPVDFDVDILDHTHSKRKHDDEIISMTQDDPDADGMLKNAYEESISEYSEEDEEEDPRQIQMAQAAVALQQTARSSADLGRRLSGRNYDVTHKREMYSMQPTHQSSMYHYYGNDRENKYMHNEGTEDSTKISTSFECDIVKDKINEKEVLHKNANATILDIKISNSEVSKPNSISIKPIDSAIFMYSTTNDEMNCDSRNIYETSNHCEPNTSRKSSGKSKGSRRSSKRDPPPRPPRQKQLTTTTLPLDIMRKQISVDQATVIFNESNHSCLENEQNRFLPNVSKTSIMSPLSSCPNIYGNVAKNKQPNHKKSPSEDVSKSISLLTTEFHILEGQGQNEILAPRKKPNLDDILMTSCILKPMVTALAQPLSPWYNPEEHQTYQESNDNMANALSTFQTSVGTETVGCTSEIQMIRQNPIKTTSSTLNQASLLLTEDHTIKSKHHDSLQNVDKRHTHSPTKVANHQRDQSKTSQIEYIRHNSNFISPTASSSINSVIYKKCKLCDKCSQKFEHSNKAVGTRGETTLI